MSIEIINEGNIKYSRIRVHSWDNFLEGLQPLEVGWVFRGQQAETWRLQPSLHRYAVQVDLASAEQQVISECQRQVHNFLSAELIPTHEAEWLALIQHFGGPTRLLDWTRSPYVAAFFAFENATATDEKCVIWAINETWCRRVATDALKRRLNISYEAAEKLAVGLGFLDDKLFKEVVRGGNARAVIPLEPDRLNQRLIIQQGLFLCPLDLRVSFIENFPDEVNSEKHILKLVLPNTLRANALDRLRRMNISRATLFPGLEGFIQSLRHSIIKESEEQTKRRLLIEILRNYDTPVRKALEQEVSGSHVATTTTLGAPAVDVVSTDSNDRPEK